jgi:hypothetical protein
MDAMDQTFATDVPKGAILLCSKSWVAYVWLVFIAGLAVFCAPLLWTWNPWAGVAAGAVSFAFVLYNVLHTHSCKLYCDDVGVWVQQGVMPWNKGVVGVKWRDIDEATYRQSLASWLTRSHTLRVGHRFTRSSEIQLTNMSGAREAVVRVNTKLMSMIQDQRFN